MSKKCNKSHQRRAERRNRNAAKRRAKRRRRTDVSEPVHLITKSSIPMETHIAYIEAHELIPPDYPRSPSDMQTELAMAMTALEDPHASDASILRAIMILAHTPDPRAREALQSYARLGTPYRDMARLGADECATWLEDVGPPLPAPSFAVTALN